MSGSAGAKTDFKPASGTVTFRPGKATATVSISLVNDRIKEDPESFSVVLSRPSSGWSVGGSGTATITITDND